MTSPARPTLLLSAAVVAAALLGGACGGSGPAAVADARSTEAPPTVLASAAELVGATAGPVTSPATAAVERWVGALATGDGDAAWALTHPRSRGAVGGRAAFEELLPALAQGYGAWGRSADATFAAVALPDLADDLAVVVIRGTIAADGPDAPAVDALPVRVEADRTVLVDPFQDVLGDEAALGARPSDGATIEPGHTFEVLLAAGRAVRLLVDDEALVTTVAGVDGDQQRATGAPASELEPGAHVLTVVLERDGAVQARAITYDVVR